MSVLTDLLAYLSGLIRPHLTFVAAALVATLLVIYGNNLNRAVWSMIRGAHFIIRTLVFVALCAFGYGALTVFLIPFVRRILLSAGPYWLAPIVIITFFLVGWLAEKNSRRG
ncbi:DUF3392 family protein [Saccharospirillum sp. HFRX-1]|uniref:DUF3392 domain-containing protein n=1 Tax=unclassified Saccharospirillum TaxID=2633430 RepID=UPI003716D5FD